MISTESIQNMFTRFIDIVNKACSLEKEFSKEELIHKVLHSLHSLTSDWDSKVTTI